MTNIYIFWKELTDPVEPWQRLTRTNRYIRFSSNVANHWTDVGSATHNHANTMSAFSCLNNTGNDIFSSGSGNTPHALHKHGAPSSWTISNADNIPPGYGLDIIYMSLTQWENTIKSFPPGSVILSNGELIDAEFTRFEEADNKYILNAEPGTEVGSEDTHSHLVSGNTQTNSTSESGRSTGSSRMVVTSHYHAISLTSTSAYYEPKNLVTRLYEISAQTSKALANTVVMVDGVVGSNWEILTTWSGSNLKSSNSNPTLSGSDTHAQTISGSSGNNSNGSNTVGGSSDYWDVSIHPHIHTVLGTLSSSSHVPLSKYVTPARLLNTLYRPQSSNRVQFVGI